MHQHVKQTASAVLNGSPLEAFVGHGSRERGKNGSLNKKHLKMYT